MVFLFGNPRERYRRMEMKYACHVLNLMFSCILRNIRDRYLPKDRSMRQSGMISQSTWMPRSSV